MIAILLSTYNGEKYLSEQIDSILSQTYSNWKLIARDDGSKDDTVSILKSYVKRFPDKIIMDDINPSNLGAGMSFMQLLAVADAEYYMFCDQDDVWMPDKIERTLKKAQEMEMSYGKDSPIGVFTDLTVVDSELNVLMPSLWKGDNRNPDYIKNFYKQWTNRHATYGCTMLINRAAKSLVFPYHQFESVVGAHDAWIEYILIKKGHFDYIDESTIYYRQHGTNVIGANTGITYKDEVHNVIYHPKLLFKKIIKDYRRTKIMPFKISYIKVLWYRISQSIKSLLK